MFDRFSSLWIRLYPSSFREQYEEEMLQLVQDRLRDEPGVLAKMRIQFGILHDLTIALPQVYAHIRSRSAHIAGANTDVLSFRVIEGQRPNMWVYATSSIVSIVMLHLIEGLHPCTGVSTQAGSSMWVRFFEIFQTLLDHFIS